MKLTTPLIFLALIGAAFSNTHKNPKACRNEKHRPQLHFSVPINWSNDPNGMFYYEGEYHLHYQHHPYSIQWGPMHWGHAITRDLVTWEDLPISLYPDDLGTIYSGSAVVDFKNTTGFQTDSTPPVVAIFTHAGVTQMQSIAYSNNIARDFTKYPGNPVIPNPGINDFRDPKVIRYEDSKWVMVVAAGQKIDFFESNDLRSWNFISDFGLNPEQGSHASVWECPDLLRIEHESFVTWVLLVSLGSGNPNGGSITQYFVGHFDGKVFSSSQINPLWLDLGHDNYASVSFFNEPQGRHLIMGWMNNLAYSNDLPIRAQNFNGIMTLPRQLNIATVNTSLRLRSSLPHEFSNLHDPAKKFYLPNLRTIQPNDVWRVSETLNFRSGLVELDLVFNIGGIKGTSSIAICFVNRLRQEVCVGYDHGRPVNHEIFLNRELSGDVGAFRNLNRATAGRLINDDIITFKIIQDVSVIQLFIDDGLTAMTSLIFPDEILDTLEIRHHASTDDSKIILINGSLQGLRSIYDC